MDTEQGKTYSKTEQQARLSDTGITNQQQLEQVVAAKQKQNVCYTICWKTNAINIRRTIN